MLGKNEISEEQIEVFSGGVNPLAHVVVIGANQGIAEIPGMTGKRFVADVEAKRAQVLDGKHCRRAGVALTESVDLPNSRDESGYVRDGIVDVQILIAEILLLLEIIIERFAYAVGTGIQNGLSFQHPLVFGDQTASSRPPPAGRWRPAMRSFSLSSAVRLVLYILQNHPLPILGLLP